MRRYLLTAMALLGCQPAAPIAYEQAPVGGAQQRQRTDDARDRDQDDWNDDGDDRIGGDDTTQDPGTWGPGTDDPGVVDPGVTDPGVTEPGVPAVRSSGGSGGQTGLVEVQFRASNGQNSSYKINAPTDVTTKVYGLHIHLHGDGGGGYRDFPNRATKQDLIGVTVKAPNTNLQWGRSAGVPHAQYLNELIQNEIVRKYNINLDRIYFSGVSGGAYFLTGNFIPTFGHNYNSGAFIMCGGEQPRVNFADPSMLTKFRMYWQVTAGERQDILSDIRASLSAYKRAVDSAVQSQGLTGFDTKTVHDSEISGNGGHCEYDGQDYTSGIQYMMDLKFSTVVVR